jgi:hypothetical protein
VTESGSSFPAEVGGSVIVWVRTEFDECGSATLNNKGTGSRRLSTVAEPTGLEPLHRPQVHFIEDVRQPQTAGVVMGPPGTWYLVPLEPSSLSASDLPTVRIQHKEHIASLGCV